MKKIYFLILACFAFGMSNAQLKEKGVVEITPKIGYSNFAEVSENTSGPTKQTGTTDYKTAFSFGTTLDYYFNNRWSLRSGFSFDKMGGKQFFNGLTYTDNFSYLSVPINVNWHFGSTRKWNLNFGLSPSFLTETEILINGSKAVSKISNPVKSFQLGFNLGIGYKIEINPKFGILIDYQGFSGLTNVSNVAGLEAKNSGGSFNLGAVIQL